MVNTKRGQSIAGHVAARVRRGGERAWSVADFSGFTTTAVTAALHRLAKDGELRSVRHGLYWRGRTQPWGMSRPDPLQIAAAVTKVDGIGWAGLSASNVLGTTTQVPAVESIAIPAPPPRPVQGIRFMNRAAKSRRAAERLNPLEVAMLEVLGDWSDVIDVSPAVAVETLAGYVRNGQIRSRKVAAAAVDESGPTRDRLRAVLRSAGEIDVAHGIAGSSTPEVTARALAGVV